MVMEDVRNRQTRKKHIKETGFNPSSYWDEQSLHYLRFRKTDLRRLSNAMRWNEGKNKRNRYGCDPVPSCCILMKRLCSCVKWYDQEPVLGIRNSHLSEIFWEVLEAFVNRMGHLATTLESYLRPERADYDGTAVHEAGVLLDRCVGFIDCTKIGISRPEWDWENQRACYSGYKGKNRLIY